MFGYNGSNENRESKIYDRKSPLLVTEHNLTSGVLVMIWRIRERSAQYIAHREKEPSTSAAKQRSGIIQKYREKQVQG